MDHNKAFSNELSLNRNSSCVVKGKRKEKGSPFRKKWKLDHHFALLLIRLDSVWNEGGSAVVSPLDSFGQFLLPFFFSSSAGNEFLSRHHAAQASCFEEHESSFERSFANSDHAISLDNHEFPFRRQNAARSSFFSSLSLSLSIFFTV